MRGIKRELAKIRANFREYYNLKLKNDYAELEPQRRKYQRRLFQNAFIFMAIAAGYIYACATGIISSEVADSDFMAKVYGLYFVAAAVVLSLPFSAYKEATKRLVMDKILAFWGNFRYFDGGVPLITREMIVQSGIFGEFNEQTSDDTFKGTYHDIAITVSEQQLQKVVRTSKGRRTVTIFGGILILLDMDKMFSGQTVVRRRGNLWRRVAGNWFWVLPFIIIAAISAIILWHLGQFYGEWEPALLGLLPLLIVLAVEGGNLWKKKKKGKQLEQVKLEDVVFEREWEVYSTNQIEARYVLTTAFMERMLEVKRRFHGNKLEFSFFDNKVLIAVHTNKDMFETTSLFASALDYRKVQEVIVQFYSVFSVADVLKGRNRAM